MTTMIEDEDELSETDLAALQLSIDLCLANDPPDEGRAEQIQDFLREPERWGRDWQSTAELCAYVQQTARLHLAPWQSPPCVLTLAEADRILAAGRRLSPTGSGEDISNCRQARLLRRMLRLGVSPFHPNPLAAIREATRLGERPRP